MIDESEDCVAKSKLTITVKIFTKCNERSRVPAKQTNKQTDSEAQKLVNILAERSQIDTQADFHIHRSKQNGALCSAVIEINK